MKRALTASILVLTALVAAYGYLETRREADYSQFIRRGDAALARGDAFAAIEAFGKAIELKDDSMVAYLKRGEAFRQRQELEAALRDLVVASELDPTAPQPLELLGDVNYAMRRYARAADRYEAYAALDDRSTRILYKLALAQYSEGRVVAGTESLRRAIALDEAFAEAHYLLALCLRDMQKPREALVAIERAVTLAPAMLEAREEMAELYGRLGRPDDRLDQLLVLRGMDPGPAREVSLGLAYARLGRPDQAVTTLRRAAERYPGHGYTYVALGRVWLEQAQARGDRIDLGKALEALEAAAGTEGTSEALTLLGRAQILASQYEQAERTLTRATQQWPIDAMAFYYLAEAAERRSHPAEARRALAHYLLLEGESRDARLRAAIPRRIGDLSMRVSEFADAARWYQRAVDAAPADPSLLARLAEAHLRAGDSQAARAALEQALAKDPENAAARALRRRIGTGA